jgi:heterodisulfide reductase subunit B
VLRRTQYFLDQRPEMLERINWFTGEPYEGKVRVTHFLELLRDRVGWQTVADQVTQPLKGLKVAPYYGCLLLRPQAEIGLDEADHPHILHECLTALGADVVDFPYQDECCGSYLLVSKPELPQKMAEGILRSARKHGAQAIATACPLCQFNLDHPQERGGAINLQGGGLPVLYFTQLMAVALGLPPEEWGLDGHTVDPRPLFAEREQKVA